MAGLADVFSEQERTNWLKACLGLNIAKHALEEFVDREVKDVHIRIFQSVRSRLNLHTATVCTNCSTANLLKCPTLNVCKKKGKNVCIFMHDTSAKQPRPCRMKLCDEIRNEIIKEHRYRQPSWKNTSAEQWASNHWEIAKCFLPPDGYIGVGSAHATDFNGIISVMLNCKHFDSKVSFRIAPPGSSCLLSKAREIGRAVRHNSDCKMSNSDLQDAFITLIGLLSDQTCLGQDRLAQEASRKIKQLQVDSLKITEAEMSQLLKNAQDILNDMKQVADESMKEMKAFVENFYKKHAALEDEDYECAVKDFVRRLKQHYHITLSHVSISTLFPSEDESMYTLYAAPFICRIVDDNKGNTTVHPVSTYKEILYTGETENLNKRIVLQGEAGMGKSTFASKLVLDWCNPGKALSSISKTFVDANTLQEFKLAFLITLRDSVYERDVTKMIKEQIIDMIYADTERNEAYGILNKIMQHETCLVVQDGLDEWKDTDGKLAQPIMLSCYSYCTVLTTTRPWKLTDERIRKSQIDSLFELKGVLDPYDLCESVLDIFGSNTLQEFKQYVKENTLHDLLLSPMLLSLIVSSWVDGTRLKGSRCEVYTVLIDGLFKKATKEHSMFVHPPIMCFQNTRYLQQNIDHLKAISKTAFVMLFSAEREHSLVISDRQLSQYLTQEQKDMALKTGILTERKFVSRTYQRSTCSFIHKSVQEFLAAVHIAENSATLVVVSRFLTENSDTLFENQIFIFLCGLNISLANELSRTIDRIIDTEPLYELQHFVSLYISGFIEAQANANNPIDIDLKLSRFIPLGLMNDVKNKAFVSILQMNKSNAKLLRQGYFSQDLLLKRLIGDDEGVRGLDLSSFLNLENIQIRNIPLQPNAFHGLAQLRILELEGCECQRLDFSSCRKLETIVLEGIMIQPNIFYGLAQLQNLMLKYCNCEWLDLSSCHNLKIIDFVGEGIMLQPNVLHGLSQLKILNLKDCMCAWLDLSSCHNIESIDLRLKITLQPNTFHGLAHLEILHLDCCEIKGLDLSSCHNLETIDFGGKQIELQPNFFHGLTRLKILKLYDCKIEEMELSSCHNLETITLRSKEITLQPNAIHGLAQLKILELQDCECEWLDLSSCQNLETIDLYYSGTLKPNAFHGLAQLKILKLKKCEIEGLRLSSCHNLETIDLFGNKIALQPNFVRGLAMLKILELRDCKYEGLDLSSCHNLKTITISGEGVPLQPNAFHGLAQLKILKLQGCECEWLDLSSCHNLETVDLIGKAITLQPNSIHELAQLRY